MAIKPPNFQMEIDPIIKSQVEELYLGLGITLPEAINIFIHQSLLVGGLPFLVKYPDIKFNIETEEAIEEARNISEGKIFSKSYKTAKELFQELDSEEC